jgi:ELWxxDGT repeat protein
VDGTLFFVMRDQLWASDGTPAGTVPLATISPLASASGSPLAGANGQLFFAGSDARSGVELWKSDGTPAGTMLLANLAPDTSRDTYGSNPSSLTNVDGTLFFVADDGVHGMELWRSDATVAGTALVKDINSGAASAFADQSGQLTAAVDGTLFFVAEDGISGGELWRSDGTDPGTVRLTHIDPGPYGPRPWRLTAVDGRLFFLSGTGLWKSDGTAPGTAQVADISVLGGFYPSALTAANGVLCFLTRGSNGTQLWRSDGRARGTMPVAEFSVTDLDVDWAGLTAVNSTVVLFAPVGATSGDGNHSASTT